MLVSLIAVVLAAVSLAVALNLMMRAPPDTARLAGLESRAASADARLQAATGDVAGRLAAVEGRVAQLEAHASVDLAPFDARIRAIAAGLEELQHLKVDTLERLATAAVDYAEQQAASAAVPWTGRDKADAALDHADHQASALGQRFERTQLRLAIEAAVGRLNRGG